MKIDIKSSALELAQLIKQDPKLIEKDLYSQGQELLALFQDSNFTDGFQNFKELKKELFLSVLEDLGMGAITLKTSSFGLIFRDGKVKTFISPLGVQPQGNVMFSISLKNVAAFKNWRNGEQGELPDEELHAAVYRMTVALAEVL